MRVVLILAAVVISGAGAIAQPAEPPRTTLVEKDVYLGYARLTPDGKALVTADRKDRILRIRDLATDKDRDWAKPVTGVRSLAVSPDGKTLAVGRDDGTVGLIDAVTGKERTSVRGREKGSPSLAFSPDGKNLATGGDLEAALWQVSDGNAAGRLIHEKNDAGERPVFVGEIHFSPDGKTIYCVCEGFDSYGYVAVWDAGTLKRRQTVWPKHRIKSMALSPDGKLLAVGDWFTSVAVWDAENDYKVLGQIRVWGGGTLALAFDHTGKRLATVSSGIGRKQSVVAVWDVATRRREQSWEVQGHWVSPSIVVQFTPDGKKLLAGSTSQGLHLWDLAAPR